MDIIFDLDGTLWDSSKIILKAWNKVFLRKGLSTITYDTLSSLLGLDMFEIADRLGIDYSIIDEMTDSEEEHIKGEKESIYKNSISTIKELSKEHRLFIVSNCQKGYIDLFLDNYELRDYFTDYLSWGDTLTSKGETIKTIMHKNNITKACYVGDTKGDQSASAHAGINFIYAKYGFGNVIVYDHSIDDISEIIQVIETFC